MFKRTYTIHFKKQLFTGVNKFDQQVTYYAPESKIIDVFLALKEKYNLKIKRIDMNDIDPKFIFKCKKKDKDKIFYDFVKATSFAFEQFKIGKGI